MSQRCPVCAAQARRQYPAKSPPAADGTFSVLRCPECGLGWSDPALPDDKIGDWYPASYYGKENVRFNAVIEWLVRLFRFRRARAIARRVPPGAVLDVGCGRGRILGY